MKESIVTEQRGMRSYPGPPPWPAYPRVGELDVRELARKLVRRRWAILTVTLVLVALATIAVFQLTPRYSAAAQIMIEPRQARIADMEEVLSGLTGERETIETELRVIRSRNLAERVIATLDLARKAEFNPALREGSPVLALLNPFSHVPEDWSVALGLGASGEACRKSRSSSCSDRRSSTPSSRASTSAPTGAPG